jgi:DNA-directed RNA polymerase specialized sigma24 family protein
VTIPGTLGTGDAGVRLHDRHDDVFAEHAEWLFNVFRLVMADRSAAAAMTAGTLADACAGPAEPDRFGLLELALARMAPSLRVPPAEAASWATVAEPAGVPAVPAGAVDDLTLALYVRSLPFPMRQVVALRAILGVDPGRVAGILGLPAATVARVERAGLGELAVRLAAHVEERDRRRPPEVPAAARAHLLTERVVAQRPAPGLVRRFMLALERLAGLAREGAAARGEERAGPVSRPATPPPTPTTRPLERPAPTPSMHDFQAPGATAGTGVHRRSPTGTPSTQRISNPRRPGRP